MAEPDGDPMRETARPSAAAVRADWRSAYEEAGPAGVQAEIRRAEGASVRVAEWQPGMVSGLLQTAAYARESLRVAGGPLDYGRTEEDLEATVAERIRRQDVLRDPGKRVQVVMTEAALRAGIVSLDTLARQLDQLITVIGLPGVSVGIIPDFGPMPHWPFGFRLYDTLAVEESSSGETWYSSPDDVARHEKIMDALFAASVTGGGAIAMVRDTAGKIRAVQEKRSRGHG